MRTPGQINVLVACECSQTVCKAFYDRGFNAFSCDIQDSYGSLPERHIKADCLEIMNDKSYKWDLIIAHPPCTYLSNVCTRGFSLRVTDAEKVVARWENRSKALSFFLQCYYADVKHIACENPVGFVTKGFRPPDQYIDPYMFATDENDLENWYSKKTGLWLRGLPLLQKKNELKFDYGIYGKYSNGKNKTWEDHTTRDPDIRSKFPTGIATAMAEQWGNYLLKECD